MTPDLIQRLAAPLPRYTSYPTANHFTPAIDGAPYRHALAELEPETKLSLYLHIPFCNELCWYCGCSTKAVRRYEPVAEYVPVVVSEIVSIACLVPGSHSVTHIHWGGGSPDILRATDIERLGRALADRFRIAPDAEFAVEIDPRLLRTEDADAFAAVGVNRVSIGVQDFDPVVQAAIGRRQGYEETKRAIDMFRDRGVGSINVDLVYGLPHQTEDRVARTLDRVLTLSPDRIAIFGYAHLPSRLKHQRLIDEAALPGPVQRFEQARKLARMLKAAGYEEIGLDHYAKPSDALAKAPLARNFQGYTTDSADALVGLGASAISKLPWGFAQNAVPVEDYTRRITEHGLATARGWRLSPDDRARADAIEELMCSATLSTEGLLRRHGAAALPVLAEAEATIASDADGFVERTGDGFRLTERGKPFVRNICARFDAYLNPEAAGRRHALSV